VIKKQNQHRLKKQKKNLEFENENNLKSKNENGSGVITLLQSCGLLHDYFPLLGFSKETKK
jgi:putative cell wall-binding protein